jgi:hypothetical protein
LVGEIHHDSRIIPTLYHASEAISKSRSFARLTASFGFVAYTHARRGLVEGAWASRYPAKVSRHLQLRLEKQSKAIQDIRWKAQVRRCKRDRTLIARGKYANQVVVAIARELVGFRWAITKQVPVTP